MICILQFLEDLTDRQAAEAVRRRIDWKYLLGLELTDPGFHYSVLSEFQRRLIEGNAEQRLLDLVLEACTRKGWIKQRGKQRTDSTHVLAVTRVLNRLEGVGETLRAALNRIATVGGRLNSAEQSPTPSAASITKGNPLMRQVTWNGSWQ